MSYFTHLCHKCGINATNLIDFVGNWTQSGNHTPNDGCGVEFTAALCCRIINHAQNTCITHTKPLRGKVGVTTHPKLGGWTYTLMGWYPSVPLRGTYLHDPPTGGLITQHTHQGWWAVCYLSARRAVKNTHHFHLMCHIDVPSMAHRWHTWFSVPP